MNSTRPSHWRGILASSCSNCAPVRRFGRSRVYSRTLGGFTRSGQYRSAHPSASAQETELVEHVGHMTHSHAYPDHASFRVTIALSRSVTAADWPGFYAAAMAHLEIPHDSVSTDPPRF